MESTKGRSRYLNASSADFKSLLGQVEGNVCIRASNSKTTSMMIVPVEVKGRLDNDFDSHVTKRFRDQQHEFKF